MWCETVFFSMHSILKISNHKIICLGQFYFIYLFIFLGGGVNLPDDIRAGQEVKQLPKWAIVSKCIAPRFPSQMLPDLLLHRELSCWMPPGSEHASKTLSQLPQGEENPTNERGDLYGLWAHNWDVPREHYAPVTQQPCYRKLFETDSEAPTNTC